jgi:hypothetical protein
LAKRENDTKAPEASAATLGHEGQLGQMVNALRGSMDAAMAGIERDNPALEGVLSKDYARPALDTSRLGRVIDMISDIRAGDDAGRLANWSFSVSGRDTERLGNERQWKHGVPPASNACQSERPRAGAAG